MKLNTQLAKKCFLCAGFAYSDAAGNAQRDSHKSSPRVRRLKGWTFAFNRSANGRRRIEGNDYLGLRAVGAWLLVCHRLLESLSIKSSSEERQVGPARQTGSTETIIKSADSLNCGAKVQEIFGLNYCVDCVGCKI
jgi:hypothetical protein